MGWCGIGKVKQRQPSQGATTDAELAFELWDSGWDGWIASEPEPLDVSLAKQPQDTKQARSA